MANKNFYIDLVQHDTADTTTISTSTANDVFKITPTVSRIAIGSGTVVTGAINTIAIGNSAAANGTAVLAIGYQAGQNSTQINSTYVGYQAGKGNAGDSVTAFGYFSARNNTGDSVTALGYYSAESNTGTSVTALGRAATQYNTGDVVTAVGRSSARNNTGDYVTALGYLSAQNNTGANTVQVGFVAGQNNTAEDVVQIGAETGYNNTGINAVQIGRFAGKNNTGDNVTQVGRSVGRYNLGDNNSLFGYLRGSAYTKGNNTGIGALASLSNDTPLDAATTISFSNTDITTNTITLVGHGYGTIGGIIVLRLVLTSGVYPTGIIADGNYLFTVTDANTLTYVGIDNAGAGTYDITAFDPTIENSSALGYDALALNINALALGAYGKSTGINSAIINTTGAVATNSTANSLAFFGTDTTEDTIISATRVHHRVLVGVGTRNVTCNAAGDLVAGAAAGTVDKYSADLAYTATVALTVTHGITGLTTGKEITWSFVDSSGNAIEPDNIGNFTATTLDVTFATTETITTTILG